MSTVSSTSAKSIIDQLQQSGSTNKSTDELGDRFLTLLVTQMQNQDPLNPMENAELTSQLAQINTVKGIESLNSTMQKLLTSYSDALSMQSSALIGKNVLAAGNKLSLGASGAMGGINLAGDADLVNVTISDSNGVKVAQQSLGAHPAGVFSFAWDGKNGDGVAVPQGNYKFTVEATQGGNKVNATPLQVGTVSALVRTPNGFQLEIPTLGQVDFSAVQQIY